LPVWGCGGVRPVASVTLPSSVAWGCVLPAFAFWGCVGLRPVASVTLPSLVACVPPLSSHGPGHPGCPGGVRLRTRQCGAPLMCCSPPTARPISGCPRTWMWPCWGCLTRRPGALIPRLRGLAPLPPPWTPLSPWLIRPRPAPGLWCGVFCGAGAPLQLPPLTVGWVGSTLGAGAGGLLGFPPLRFRLPDALGHPLALLVPGRALERLGALGLR
jgi:hypothetical protein